MLLHRHAKLDTSLGAPHFGDALELLASRLPTFRAVVLAAERQAQGAQSAPAQRQAAQALRSDGHSDGALAEAAGLGNNGKGRGRRRKLSYSIAVTRDRELPFEYPSTAVQRPVA